MFRSLLVSALALGSLATNPAQAAEVRLAYKGVITSSIGQFASAFTPGQTIKIVYVLETSTPDQDPSASIGVYNGGLRKLSITVPVAGLQPVSGPGTATIYDELDGEPFDVFTVDSADLKSGASFAGRTLTGLGFTFLNVDGRMVSSDSLPTTHLVHEIGSVALRIGESITNVRFKAEPDLSIASCAGEGYLGAKLTLCRQICEIEQAPATLTALIKLYTTLYRAEPPCAQ